MTATPARKKRREEKARLAALPPGEKTTEEQARELFGKVMEEKKKKAEQLFDRFKKDLAELGVEIDVGVKVMGSGKVKPEFGFILKK